MTQKTLSAIMILFIAVTLTGAEKNVEVEITLVDIRNGATLDQGDYIILRPTYSSREPISLERQESGRWRGVVPYGNYMVEASAPLHAPTRYLLSLWQNRYYLSLGLSQSLTSLHACPGSAGNGERAFRGSVDRPAGGDFLKASGSIDPMSLGADARGLLRARQSSSR